MVRDVVAGVNAWGFSGSGRSILNGLMRDNLLRDGLGGLLYWLIFWNLVYIRTFFCIRIQLINTEARLVPHFSENGVMFSHFKERYMLHVSPRLENLRLRLN